MKYTIVKHNGRDYWLRIIGHRGGRTYEIGEPAEIGKGRKIIRRNVGFWVGDEKEVIIGLINKL